MRPDDGPALRVRFIGHATVLLDLGDTRILTDPFLRPTLGPLERHGPIPDRSLFHRLDLVVISHAHADHFDPASLRTLPDRPTVIVPRGLGPAAARAVAGEVAEVEAGEAIEIALDGRAPVRVSAVPARHWMTLGGPPAVPIGYVIDRDVSIYFAGDTGPLPGIAAAAGGVDLALLPVWTWGPHLGPGHLGPRAAAELLAELGARAAIPIHWGTLYPRRLHRIWRAPLREPGELFAAHVRETAPDADVRVLRPGESTTFSRLGGRTTAV